MTILRASVGTSAQFFERYLADLPGGGLFIPMQRPLAIGTPVVVLVRAGVRAVPILLRGSVVLIRSGKHKPRTKAGIGVEFLASEKSRRNYLLARARGEIAGTADRRHQRLPIDLPIRWSLPGSPEDRLGILRDIGRGGAFVESHQPTLGPDIGPDVVLKVIPPGAVAETPMTARIAWVAPGPVGGFGVSWNAPGPVGLRRIKELIRRMEKVVYGETS